MSPPDPGPADPGDPTGQAPPAVSASNPGPVPDTGPMGTDAVEEPLEVEKPLAEEGVEETAGAPRAWWRDPVLARMALVGGLVGVIALVGVLPQHRVRIGHVARPSSPPLLSPAPEPVASPTPPPFAFRLVRSTYVGLSKRGGKAAARRAGARIRDLLSGFYRLAYFDPAAWAGDTPGRAWRAFAPETVRQARRDARALTLGRVDGLEGLRAGSARLFVRVLLDPSLHPQSAVALVKFHATGTLGDGRTVAVSANPLFVLRPSGSRWVIVGYPKARTVLDVRSAPPTPSATPTPSAGSPTAFATAPTASAATASPATSGSQS
jgi:hypothetical protein